MKTGVENYFFWSEIGSGFEEPGSTPPLRIPRSNPPGLEALTGGGGEKKLLPVNVLEPKVPIYRFTTVLPMIRKIYNH